MSTADRPYDRRVRVEFINGPLDGLVSEFTEDRVFDEPVIRGQHDGQAFEGMYVILRRLIDSRWVARYTLDAQEQAA